MRGSLFFCFLFSCSFLGGVQSFFNLCFAIFHYFRKIVGYYLFKYFPSLFLFCFWYARLFDKVIYILQLLDALFCFIHSPLDVWTISIDSSSSSLILFLAVLILLMSLWKAYFIPTTGFLYFNFCLSYISQFYAGVCHMHVYIFIKVFPCYS